MRRVLNQTLRVVWAPEVDVRRREVVQALAPLVECQHSPAGQWLALMVVVIDECLDLTLQITCFRSPGRK